MLTCVADLRSTLQARSHTNIVRVGSRMIAGDASITRWRRRRSVMPLSSGA
jgi:hypothetical protein